MFEEESNEVELVQVKKKRTNNVIDDIADYLNGC